jgi:hypothetical protein
MAGRRAASGGFAAVAAMAAVLEDEDEDEVAAEGGRVVKKRGGGAPPRRVGPTPTISASSSATAEALHSLTFLVVLLAFRKNPSFSDLMIIFVFALTKDLLLLLYLPPIVLAGVLWAQERFIFTTRNQGVFNNNKKYC